MSVSRGPLRHGLLPAAGAGVTVWSSACREVTCFPLLSPEAERNPSAAGRRQWLSCASWALLGIAGLAAAFFTALYSLDLNKDQASSWVVSMMLSVLQNIFISQPVKVGGRRGGGSGPEVRGYLSTKSHGPDKVRVHVRRTGKWVSLMNCRLAEPRQRRVAERRNGG